MVTNVQENLEVKIQRLKMFDLGIFLQICESFALCTVIQFFFNSKLLQITENIYLHCQNSKKC